MKALTKADQRHLDLCPENKWFEGIDVWPKVKRSDYSLGRLVDAGVLNTRMWSPEGALEERQYFKEVRK